MYTHIYNTSLYIYIYQTRIHVYEWNPSDPCFDLKGPSRGGFKTQKIMDKQVLGL